MGNRSGSGLGKGIGERKGKDSEKKMVELTMVKLRECRYSALISKLLQHESVCNILELKFATHQLTIRGLYYIWRKRKQMFKSSLKLPQYIVENLFISE